MKVMAMVTMDDGDGGEGDGDDGGNFHFGEK